MSLLNTKHEKKSFTLTTLLLSALLLVLFYIGLTYMDPPIESGISVNFGTTSFGMGKQQPKEKIKSQPVETKEVVEEEVVHEKQVTPTEEIAKEEVVEKPAEKILTQDSEESVKIKQQQEAKRRAEEATKQAKAEAERIEKEKRDAEEKARQEKEAKKQKLDALMGGLNKSDGTVKGGEGDDDNAGDKGQPDGDPYATSYYGSAGSGSGTGGYGLNGRSLVGKGKVQQECNEEGRVVVKIVVDRNGKVVSATPGVRGTTNNDPCLLDPAKKTAFLHKWNTDENAPDRQVGFVVVNFKLSE
ncbi:cell envelope integrity protein TolA [Flavobacteriaceae bacterium F89]|uniref:Cell envelope integrity protein TolA n=1 Tax=Cerina litoralis TaxID=2874477 RepID=A0AAE3EYG5_9FLAO|nr:cell envelope integrity protein TolA [Cerina litoralis]MCG2462633.1 cell envelope integrity protein TolA [Cerina litoralis]